MNAPFQYPALAERHRLPDSLRWRLILSAVLEHDYRDVPIGLFKETDWHDCAQWLADVQAEPEDEQQVIDDCLLMEAKSECFDRWMRLEDRRKDEWGDFATFWEHCGKPAFEAVS